jgi:hypothetical protein
MVIIAARLWENAMVQIEERMNITAKGKSARTGHEEVTFFRSTRPFFSSSATHYIIPGVVKST